MTTPDDIPLRSRTLGIIEASGGNVLTVDHVYEPEGPVHDAGMVGLLVDGPEVVGKQDGEMVSLELTAEAALVLANRLTRAATAVLDRADTLDDAVEQP